MSARVPGVGPSLPLRPFLRRPARGGQWLRLALWVLLCASMLAGLAPAAQALEVAVVLSAPEGPQRAFAEALQLALRPGSHRLLPAGSSADGLDARVIEGADLVIAAGIPAAEAVLRAHRRPVLAVLLGAAPFAELKRRHPGAEVAALVLDQPVERQLRLIAAALPAARRLGVLIGPDSGELAPQLDAAAAATGLELTPARIERSAQLVRVLETLLPDSGALLALPDGELSKPAAARTILLTSYRFRRPIFAFSAAYVEAGALAAVFSTPEQVAHDLADWLHALRPGRPRLKGAMPPVRFSVAVNRQVARALNLTIPAERDLLERIAAAEVSR